MAALEVFVAPGCDACDHARDLARRAAEEFGGVQVTVIDIEAGDGPLPAEVFAVPSFLFDGALISLGNPSWERLSTLLADGTHA